jgi:glycyl-tRNA synthetase
VALDVMDKLASLCKRRGFIYPSSEIYGGFQGFWDYGPMGVELKNNVKAAWWKYMVQERENIVGMDASIICHPRVWEASGHVEGFHDPMVDCRESKVRYRADQIMVYMPKDDDGQKFLFAFIEGDPESIAKKTNKMTKGAFSPDDCTVEPLTHVPLELYERIVGPDTKTPGTLTEPRQFNLMLSTKIGALESSQVQAYLRPETCQALFYQFLNVLNDSRQRIPFGIAQIGSAFRNEVTPRNFTFRSREFEQMEMEFYVSPDAAKKQEWLEYWREERHKWYRLIGIRPGKLRYRQHEPDELAHYAAWACDIEYEYPFGWKELEGIHDRGNYDLSRHAEFSGKTIEYFDDLTKERYVPHVVETSAGCTRTCLVALCDAYAEETDPERTVLHLSPVLAPIKVGVFPLMRKDGLPEKAREVQQLLKSHHTVFYDDIGNIGRRYRRQDEIGTPCCVTIDHDTLEDNTVTLRNRDTLQQIREPVGPELVGHIQRFLDEMAAEK